MSSNCQTAGVCDKYVNLMNDVAFQWVFGQESNKDLLIALLNELLPELHIEMLDFYKQRQTSIDKRAQLKYAIEKGLAEGREKGLAEGREKGCAEGRAEGTLDTARKLKAEGIPADVIAKCTDLTLEQIAGL